MPAGLLTGLAGLFAALLVLTGCDSGGSGSSSSSADRHSTAPAPARSLDSATHYVNLGDSYGAGTGTRPLVGGSPFLCQRSQRDFAHVLAQRRHLRLVDVSCAGADTTDFAGSQYDGVSPQFDALSADAGLVTVMIGGNDNSTFSSAIRGCREAAADDPNGSPCRERHGESLIAPINATTYPRLVAVLRRIHQRAPKARVLIVGYPWILPATHGCYPTMQIAAGDVSYLRELQTALNSAVERAANATGSTYVDMSHVSEGHDACAGADRWIEPMTISGPGAVHPNVRGQQAIADQVAAALR